MRNLTHSFSQKSWKLTHSHFWALHQHSFLPDFANVMFNWHVFCLFPLQTLSKGHCSYFSCSWYKKYHERFFVFWGYFFPYFIPSYQLGWIMAASSFRWRPTEMLPMSSIGSAAGRGFCNSTETWWIQTDWWALLLRLEICRCFGIVQNESWPPTIGGIGN